jgi:hypothetical protein
LRGAVVLATLLLVASSAMAPGAARAGWASSVSGSAYSKAQVMPTGSTPAVSVSNRDATVTWSASTFVGGAAVGGYAVERYEASTDALQAVGAGCSGTITALACTEMDVPPGSWRYTVTPILEGWIGGESAKSSTAVVTPPTLTFTSPTPVTSLPAPLEGTVAGYEEGETLTFRLDDPDTGTLLSGGSAPSPVPADGSADITVTIPAGVGNGAHTVYAVGSSGSTAAAGITVAVDTQAPSISGAVIAKTQGGTAAYITQGGTYYVYANVSDDGAAASGVAGATADVSSITSGQTAAALSPGSYTVGGTAYSYRSSQLTVGNPLAAGSYSFSITAADIAGNGASQNGFSITVDNTAPAAVDVQTTNVAGGTAGQAEAGDTITFTFSETVDADSILASWTGGATTITLRLVNGGAGNDSVEIWNAANTTQLPLGTVNLGSTAHVTATVTFTGSTMTLSGSSITVTLGTASGATSRANPSRMTWTPSATATDRAGNACSTTAANESGSNDRDF